MSVTPINESAALHRDLIESLEEVLEKLKRNEIATLGFVVVDEQCETQTMALFGYNTNFLNDLTAGLLMRLANKFIEDLGDGHGA